MHPYLFIKRAFAGSVKSVEVYDSLINLHPDEEYMQAFYELSENVWDKHAVELNPN